MRFLRFNSKFQVVTKKFIGLSLFEINNITRNWQNDKEVTESNFNRNASFHILSVRENFLSTLKFYTFHNPIILRHSFNCVIHRLSGIFPSNICKSKKKFNHWIMCFGYVKCAGISANFGNWFPSGRISWNIAPVNLISVNNYKDIG